MGRQAHWPYAKFNPADLGPGITLSNGYRQMTCVGSPGSPRVARTPMDITDKKVVEWTITANSGSLRFGASSILDPTNLTQIGDTANSIGIDRFGNVWYGAGILATFPTVMVIGDRISFALDGVNVWWLLNGAFLAFVAAGGAARAGASGTANGDGCCLSMDFKAAYLAYGGWTPLA